MIAAMSASLLGSLLSGEACTPGPQVELKWNAHASEWGAYTITGCDGVNPKLSIAMLAGVPKDERRARIGEIAAGINHWAIPQEEGRHLVEAVHSGLVIGKVKCKGDKAMCAHCLKNGVRTEETAVHAHYKCPKAKAV